MTCRCGRHFDWATTAEAKIQLPTGEEPAVVSDTSATIGIAVPSSESDTLDVSASNALQRV